MRRPAILAFILAGACHPHQTSLPVANDGASAVRAEVGGDQPVAGQARLLPGDKQDGADRAIRVGPKEVLVRPFRILATRALSGAQCGVLIDEQRLVTLGGGDLDAYTCFRLLNIRPLPSDSTGPRLGLLYDAGSPHARFTTAVLLVRDGKSRWQVDADATTIYDDLSVKSWESFTKALAARR